MKSIFLFLPILCSLIHLQAQPITLQSAGKGVFLLLPDTDLVYQELELKRSQRGKFKTIARLRPPQTEQELQDRYQEAKPLFPPLLRDESEQLSIVWEYLSEQKPLDQLPVFRYPAVQLAMGIAWLDQEAESGQTYQYQLSSPVSRNTYSGQIRHQAHSFQHEAFEVLQSSRDAEYPTVEWWSPFADGMVDYQVFRKTLADRSFTEVWPLRQKGFSQDSLRLLMTDTTIREEGIFEYYVVPMDLWGNQGNPSQRAQAGNFSTRSQPSIVNFRAESLIDQRQLKLSWSLRNAHRVRSLSLYQSRQPREGFELVRELTPADSSFVSSIDEPGEGYYYYLQIHDITDKQLQSVTIFGLYTGSHAAEPPVRVAAESLEEGVRLDWEGRGENVRGYYVFRAKGYRGEMRQISPFLAAESRPHYLDTAQLQAGTVYSYAVKAESKSYVLGELSERVAVRSSTPTHISAPVSLQSQIQPDGRVRISWENLYHREAQLSGYHLYRREAGEREFRQITREMIPFRQNFAYDLQTDAGRVYEYAAQAFDVYGKKSSLSTSTQIYIPLPNLPQRLGVRRFSAGILLQWNAPQTDLPYQVSIYRGQGLGDMRLWRQPSSREQQLIDELVQPGTLYTYRLDCLDSEGNTLSSSDAVSIRF